MPVQSLTVGSGAHVDAIGPDVQQNVFCAPLTPPLLHVSDESAWSGDVAPEHANPNELSMHPGIDVVTVHSL
jgi:hypothetical protein